VNRRESAKGGMYENRIGDADCWKNACKHRAGTKKFACQTLW